MCEGCAGRCAQGGCWLAVHPPKGRSPRAGPQSTGPTPAAAAWSAATASPPRPTARGVRVRVNHFIVVWYMLLAFRTLRDKTPAATRLRGCSRFFLHISCRGRPTARPRQAPSTSPRTAPLKKISSPGSAPTLAFVHWGCYVKGRGLRKLGNSGCKLACSRLHKRPAVNPQYRAAALLAVPFD